MVGISGTSSTALREEISSNETQPGLRGLTVIDLTQVVSGAVTTMLMADLGADVIKIEPPEGEAYRRTGYPLTGKDGASTNLNILRFSRGKKSVTLNLKSPGGRDVFRDLLKHADVLVENFRPGVLARLGFPPDELRRINPALTYASVSGYGHDDLYPSPFRDLPAYAIVVEAMAGLTHLARDNDGRPVWMGFAMADIFSGTLAFAGILLALRERDRTGKGGRVDIAMYDGALFMNDLAITMQSVLSEVAGPGNYALQTPWGPYATSDGYVVIAVLNESHWQDLCQIIDRNDLAVDARLSNGRARSDHHDALVGPAITAWTCARTKDECMDFFLSAGIPAAPVQTTADLPDCPQAKCREMFVQVADSVIGPVQLVGNPIKTDLPPLGKSFSIPQLGEHTDAVLQTTLGMGTAERERLRNEGAFGDVASAIADSR